MNQPLRVLHCYSGNLYGGIERTLATLARCGGLTPEVSHEFALVFPGRLHDELLDEKARVSVLGPARMAKPWTILNVRRRFSRLLRAMPPDLVICHSAWPHAIFAPDVRRAGIPLAFWAHDVPTGKHWSERLAARTAPDMSFANSEFTALSLGSIFKARPYAVARCPVQPPSPEDESADTKQKIRNELRTDRSAVVIAIAARLEAFKGHAVLLEGLAMLADVPGWTLWIIGGVQKPGEQEVLDRLTEMATRSQLRDRIRFLGQRSDVQKLLSAADIHCQPNLRAEAFGLGFVEALYAGVPVVTTPLGGALETVDDSCGVMTPPGDAVALAQVLKRLILDPTLRRTLGAAGRFRAAELCEPARTMQHISALCAEVAYRPVLNGAGARG